MGWACWSGAEYLLQDYEARKRGEQYSIRSKHCIGINSMLLLNSSCYQNWANFRNSCTWYYLTYLPQHTHPSTLPPKHTCALIHPISPYQSHSVSTASTSATPFNHLPTSILCKTHALMLELVIFAPGLPTYLVQQDRWGPKSKATKKTINTKKNSGV